MSNPFKRRKIDPSSCSLIELCILGAGSYRGAPKLAGFILAWATVRRDLGHSPTIEEYAEWWNESPRNAYYEQVRFREAFPKLATPDPIVDALEAAGAGAESGASSLDLSVAAA
jgi:hypothetical protein